MQAKSAFSLKDHLFNAEKVDYLASLVESAASDTFPTPDFRKSVLSAFPVLELKQRIDHIATCLRAVLPDDYPSALETILRALPPELDATRSDDDFGDFIIAPLSRFVSLYGCERRYLPQSLPALREITKRFSAEDAIRYFINEFPDESMEFLLACADDKNYHVRRLASEGTRPRLPWSPKVSIDYRTPLPILEKLYRDPTRYVTRSVANHLNDISKLDAPLVLEMLRRWKELDRAGTGDRPYVAGPELEFIAKHALRTRIKDGDQEALAFLGFRGVADVTVHAFATSTPVVTIGEALVFGVDLQSNARQSLLLDYIINFARDGKPGGRKVFKMKQFELAADERREILKKHPLRPMTTRRLYPGQHTVTLQINGKAAGNFSFELRTAD